MGSKALECLDAWIYSLFHYTYICFIFIISQGFKDVPTLLLQIKKKPQNRIGVYIKTDQV